MASTRVPGRLLSLILLVVVAGCTGGSTADKAGGASGQQPRVLTMAHFDGGSTELDAFVSEVAQLSGGTIRIQVRSGWRAGQVDYETGLIDDVRAGRADLGSAGSRAWDSAGVLSLRALHAPLLIDTFAMQERVVRSPLVGEMLAGLERIGLAGLGVLPGPMRKPLGIPAPLVAPADYAGRTIGVQQSLVADETMRVLGARPVWFPGAGEIDRFDGIEQQTSSIDGNRYDKVGKHLTANVNLWPRPLVIFTSKQLFDALSPGQRDALRQAVANVTPDQTAALRGAEQEAAGNLCRRGLKFETASPADVAALRTAVQPVYDTLSRDPQTKKFLDAIIAIGDGVPAEPAPSCAPAGPAGEESSQLDGVYRVTTSVQDLIAAGAPAGDVAPENYGTWTFVIDRGRFAYTQQSEDACTWGYGRSAVTGRELAWTFTAGGGSNRVSRPGELLTWGWSLYRETLTLTPLEGKVSAHPFRAKPWKRISATPSPRYFAGGCPPPDEALTR